MNAYETKQAERKECLAQRAERLQAEANSRFDRAHTIADGIPFGQPILVGHHSERHHRADLKRIDNNMRKGLELQKAADEAERRANIESTAISSDDPDAPKKLRERLARLEANQTMMVEANKIYRAKLDDDDKVRQLMAFGLREKAARSGLLPDFAGRIGVPGYALTNNSANIRRLRERLTSLEKRAESSPRPDITGDGFVVREDIEDNRLLIIFDEIPDAARRAKLKGAGFKWSPTRMAWVRMLNNAARYAAIYATT